MMLLEVTTNSGQLVGTLIDLASDTNYISNEAAERLKLNGENIKLIVQGVGGMGKTVATKIYTLRLRVKTPKGTVAEHKLLCYGLESIAKVNQAVTPEQLQKFFPDVALQDLVRPEKIDLLISHREGRLVPQPIKVAGDLVLWDGPLGKTVGGTHPDLFEVVDLAVHRSETHVARSMRTASRVYREILVDPAGPSEAQVGAGETILQENPPFLLLSVGLPLNHSVASQGYPLTKAIRDHGKSQSLWVPMARTYFTSCWSYTGIKITNLRTSLRMMMVVGMLESFLRALDAKGAGRPTQVAMSASRTTCVSDPSGYVVTIRPSRNCPLRAFWSATQTTSPAWTLLSVRCHSCQMNKFGPAGSLHFAQNSKNIL